MALSHYVQQINWTRNYATISQKKSPPFQSLRQPFPIFELFDEHLPHEIEGLDDFGIGNPIVNIQAFSTSHDDPLLAQNREVLGHISFGNSQLIDDLADSEFVIPQRFNDLQPLGMRKDLADFGVVLKERGVLIL